MKFFYLASNPNNQGEFKIHERECEHIPDLHDREYLGPFNNGSEAMRKAKDLNPKASTCEICCGQTFQTVFVRKK